MTANNNLEVEIKFHVPELNAFRQRLVATGARQIKPRTYERNIRFDNAWEGLRRKGQLLRLRQDDHARLTFKGIPPDQAPTEVKVREELEVEVSDFDTLAQLLEKIGLEPLQVYEKYRETFALGSVEIVLDEMPFGNFVELEGPEKQIKQLAGRLSLDWDRRVLPNYLALMGMLIKHHDLPFQDLTFANFADTDISIADIL
jgi:adenylate cyclase class 2